MAGYIHISEEVGCSMGAQDFRALMISAKDYFLPEEASVMIDLYEYYEATGDCLVVLKDKGKTEFNIFFRAISHALNDDLLPNNDFSPALANEIIEKLKADPRCETERGV